MEHYIVGHSADGQLATACDQTVPMFPLPDGPRCPNCIILLTSGVVS